MRTRVGRFVVASRPTARPAAGRDPTDLTRPTAGRRAGGSTGRECSPLGAPAF
jgi:hypothetical protein